MTQNQIPNQYSNNPTAPGTTPERDRIGRSDHGRFPGDARRRAGRTACPGVPDPGLRLDVRRAARDGRRRRRRPVQRSPVELRRGQFLPVVHRPDRDRRRISGAIKRISATAALGLFFVYAASLGITIGLIVASYTTGSVVTAFLSASAMFGAAAIYGHVTKRSLAKLGSILFMGLIGLLVAMVLNIFLQSAGSPSPSRSSAWCCSPP